MEDIRIETRKKLKDNPLCSCCGKEYEHQSGNFFYSDSPIYAGNKGFFRICKECTEKLYSRYVKQFSNSYKAMERMCQIFDIYYDVVALEKVLEKNTENIMAAYIKKMQLFQYNGKTYSDTIVEKTTETIDTVEDVQKHDDSQNVRKAVSVWGYGFSPEEYAILNEMYDDWRARVVIDKAKEALVRELCIIKLQMNTAIKERDVDIYTKLMNTYLSTMRSANLQPLQEDSSSKEGEKPVGVMIKMLEDYKPVCQCPPEYQDVDGIVKYVQVYFIGHLSAMLKLKNKYSEMYRAEMEKFRVENPFLQGQSDEDVFTSMFVGDETNGSI